MNRKKTYLVTSSGMVSHLLFVAILHIFVLQPVLNTFVFSCEETKNMVELLEEEDSEEGEDRESEADRLWEYGELGTDFESYESEKRAAKDMIHFYSIFQREIPNPPPEYSLSMSV